MRCKILSRENASNQANFFNHLLGAAHHLAALESGQAVEITAQFGGFFGEWRVNNRARTAAAFLLISPSPISSQVMFMPINSQIGKTSFAGGSESRVFQLETVLVPTPKCSQSWVWLMSLFRNASSNLSEIDIKHNHSKNNLANAKITVNNFTFVYYNGFRC
jgi:hypothetical protein